MDHFWEKTVIDCTAVPQQVICPQKKLHITNRKMARTRQVARDQDLLWLAKLSSIEQLLDNLDRRIR